jgi:hypothetical protein
VKELSETKKPSSRSLFESIKRLVEAANMMWARGINKPGRVLAVHGFFKFSMEKSIFDVHLVDVPGM